MVSPLTIDFAKTHDALSMIRFARKITRGLDFLSSGARSSVLSEMSVAKMNEGISHYPRYNLVGKDEKGVIRACIKSRPKPRFFLDTNDKPYDLWISWILVAQPWRQQQVGQRLLNQLLQGSKTRPETIGAAVHRRNKASRQFFEKNGFSSDYLATFDEVSDLHCVYTRCDRPPPSPTTSPEKLFY